MMRHRYKCKKRIKTCLILVIMLPMTVVMFFAEFQEMVMMIRCLKMDNSAENARNREFHDRNVSNRGITASDSHGFRNERLHRVSCKSIIDGDSCEIFYAQKLSRKNGKQEITPEQYTSMTRNCSDFILRRGYITHHLTQTEQCFPIAFSILMYKDVEQSERLLRAIYRPQNIYCIHVDAKSDIKTYEAMKNIATCFENVILTNKRYTVEWGTITVLEPELQCMEELWTRHTSWKYFINLTGQEFPIKTNYELVRVLMALNGSNDIEGSIDRWQNRWQAASSPPHNITPTKGSVHILASRGYVNFILHDRRAHDFLKWTRDTTIPDETFFSSLNHNSELGVPGSYAGTISVDGTEKIKPLMSRYKIWKDQDLRCRGKFVNGICIIGIGDLQDVIASTGLFVNKIDLKFQPFVLDCLEEYNCNRTRDIYSGKQTFDASWYATLDFVSNKVRT